MKPDHMTIADCGLNENIGPQPSARAIRRRERERRRVATQIAVGLVRVADWKWSSLIAQASVEIADEIIARTGG